MQSIFLNTFYLFKKFENQNLKKEGQQSENVRLDH